jgi:hypothetical protein
MKYEVGRFALEDGVVSGPAEYMRERGDARLREIEAGRDSVFNAGLQFGSPNVETAILVSLQTDYAGWLGQKQMEGWLGR